ncbi:MAG TPA: endonuclease domain-containing protein, partial [Armatimonadota bacterium]|nr:endonuclease domain-containing protein [Armatimonadota bacterium]
MKQYATFTFDSYRLDPASRRVELHYSLDDAVRFTETVTFPAPWNERHDRAAVDRALATLHLLGGISYYKTCCPKRIEVRTAPLSEEQARFFERVYENGLGEFFYRNDLDFRGLVRFPASGEGRRNEAHPAPYRPRRVLAPIGGGKDSIVTAEWLKEAG